MPISLFDSARVLSVTRAAEKAPEQIAVLHAKGAVTFRALATRVVHARRWLSAHGLAPEVPESRHAFFVPRAELDDLVMLYALMETGRPVWVGHPRFSNAETSAWVKRLRPAVEVPQVRPEVRGPLSTLPVTLDPERMLATFLTSGTTGLPKAVMLPRRAFIAAARASAANLGFWPDDRWLLSIPPAHVGGFSVLTRCLIAQKTVVLAPTRNLDDFLRTLVQYRVTLASLVPTQLYRLLQHRPDFRPPDCLRAVLLGGAAAAPDLVDRARAAGWPILTTYGLTEACAQVSTERPGHPGPSGTSGRPLPGVHVRVNAGRIQVRGSTLMSGYRTESESSFIVPNDWFDTGDRGAWVDGHLKVWGRGADLIVTGGENVFPGEVEAVLKTHPDVQDILIFGVPHPEWGEAVAAAVILAPGATLEGLREAARPLTPFKRPKFGVPVTTLPVTAAGKPNRRGARTEWQDRLIPLSFE